MTGQGRLREDEVGTVNRASRGFNGAASYRVTSEHGQHGYSREDLEKVEDVDPADAAWIEGCALALLRCVVRALGAHAVLQADAALPVPPPPPDEVEQAAAAVDEGALASLRSRFSHFGEAQLRRVLATAGGDINAAVDRLVSEVDVEPDAEEGGATDMGSPAQVAEDCLVDLTEPQRDASARVVACALESLLHAHAHTSATRLQVVVSLMLLQAAAGVACVGGAAASAALISADGSLAVAATKLLVAVLPTARMDSGILHATIAEALLRLAASEDDAQPFEDALRTLLGSDGAADSPAAAVSFSFARAAGAVAMPQQVAAATGTLGSQLWRHLPLVMALRRVDGDDAAANTANATFVVGLLHTALCGALGDDGRSNRLPVLERAQHDAPLRELALELVLLFVGADNSAAAGPRLAQLPRRPQRSRAAPALRSMVVLQLCVSDAAALLQSRARAEQLLRALLFTLCDTPGDDAQLQRESTTAAATLLLGMHAASVGADDPTLAEALIEQQFRELLSARLASRKLAPEAGSFRHAGQQAGLQSWLASERTLQSIASPAAGECSSPPPPFRDGTAPSLCPVGALRRFFFANLAPRYAARYALCGPRHAALPRFEAETLAAVLGDTLCLQHELRAASDELRDALRSACSRLLPCTEDDDAGARGGESKSEESGAHGILSSAEARALSSSDMLLWRGASELLPVRIREGMRRAVSELLADTTSELRNDADRAVHRKNGGFGGATFYCGHPLPRAPSTSNFTVGRAQLRSHIALLEESVARASGDVTREAASVAQAAAAEKAGAGEDEGSTAAAVPFSRSWAAVLRGCRS